MKREKAKFGRNPLRLHQDVSDKAFLNKPIPKNKSEENSSPQDTIQPVKNNAISNKFSERYIAEIVAPKKMALYENFANNHKKLLSLENKELQLKFSEELLEAQNIEKSVMEVSSLLNEFSRILELQSDGLTEIHKDTQDTASFVKEAESQLDLTIERSKSSQKNMVFVTLGLAFLLLLLDYLTP
jgi:hypothetical protein